MPDSPNPPEPPRIPGRVRMPPARLAGTLVLALIPCLALGGAFSQPAAARSMAAASFRAEVHYPARIDHQQQARILVRVQNQTPRPLTAVVRFDPALIERFSDVAFIPAEEAAYDVRLAEIPPGQSAKAQVSFRGDAFGAHRGTLEIAAGSGDTAAVTLETLVFP